MTLPRPASLAAALPFAIALVLATSARAAEPTSATAILKDAANADLGTVTLTQTADGLAGTIDVKNLTPGPHGMHIHAIGLCQAPDFTSAGGHLNPDGHHHGVDNALSPRPHQGDLPQLIVGPDGTAHQSFTAQTSFAALFDADGAAFVVHAGADDMKSDPSGNSGSRILCGVFEPSKD